jgi:hypothetical protein
VSFAGEIDDVKLVRAAGEAHEDTREVREFLAFARRDRTSVSSTSIRA